MPPLPSPNAWYMFDRTINGYFAQIMSGIFVCLFVCLFDVVFVWVFCLFWGWCFLLFIGFLFVSVFVWLVGLLFLFLFCCCCLFVCFWFCCCCCCFCFFGGGGGNCNILYAVTKHVTISNYRIHIFAMIVMKAVWDINYTFVHVKCTKSATNVHTCTVMFCSHRSTAQPVRMM